MVDFDENDGDDETPEETPAAKPAKVGKKRPPPLAGVGAPSRAAGFQRESNEADLIWNQLVEWLPSQGMTPYDVYMQVKRVMPPPAGPVGRLQGQAVGSGEGMGPGAALIEYIERYIHAPTSPGGGPATYDVEFHSTRTGGTIAVGRLQLADVNSIVAATRAREQAGVGAAPGGYMMPPPPMPQAPAQAYFQPHMMAPPPPYQPSWGPFGAPPAPPQAPPPPQVPPEFMQMFGSMMTEFITAAREGRQPQPMAPGVAAPSNEEAIANRITAAVLMKLQSAGVGLNPPVATPPVAIPVAAQAQAPASGLGAMVERIAMGLTETIIKSAGAQMEASIKQSMGMGAPPQAAEEEEEPAAAVTVPEKPEDMLPWQVAATGATWGDGRPVNFAKNKETGNIDPMGVLMTNPVIGEKAMVMAEGLGRVLQEAIQKMTAPPPPPGVGQVVRQIPQNAVDAGMGYTPSNGAPPATPSGWESP